MKKQITDYPSKISIDNTDIFICSTSQGVVNTVTGDAIKTLVGNNNWLIITNALSPYNAVAGHRLVIDCTNGSITINLPSNPSLGDEIVLICQNVTSVKSLTINPSSKSINGSSGNLTLTTTNQRISLIFGNGGWVRNFFNIENIATGNSSNPENIITVTGDSFSSSPFYGFNSFEQQFNIGALA